MTDQNETKRWVLHIHSGRGSRNHDGSSVAHTGACIRDGERVTVVPEADLIAAQKRAEEAEKKVAWMERQEVAVMRILCPAHQTMELERDALRRRVEKLTALLMKVQRADCPDTCNDDPESPEHSDLCVEMQMALAALDAEEK